MISLAAAVFQFVFLSHHIHGKVKDEDMAESARQYPVLVGDFMFGRTFLKLCERIFFLMRDICKLIETINEGTLMRWRMKNKNFSMKGLPANHWK
jgi:hypothetical protein